MSTNTQVNNTNQGPTSTTIAPGPTPPAPTSSTQKSGQALAGALWEALSEVTTAMNECIGVYRDIGLQACVAANTMTDTKAAADRKKSVDTANQYYFDAGAKILGATCTVVGAGVAHSSNKQPSAEIEAIDTKLTRLNSMKADLNEPFVARPPVIGRAGQLQAPVDPVAAVNDPRYRQLTGADGSGADVLASGDPVTDKALIQRTPIPDREPIRNNINEKMKELEQEKNTRESTRNFNQTRWNMHTQIASSTLDATSGGLRGWQQEDIGKQDYESAEAANVQQQMSSLIGSAGSAQNSTANSASQAIQAYTEMEKANANSSR